MRPELLARRALAPRTNVIRDRRLGWLAIQSDRRAVLLDEGLGEIATVPLPEDALGNHGVAPDGGHVAVSARSRVAYISARGRLEWEIPHPPWGRAGSERGSCYVTDDGAHVWATVPGASGPDEWWLIETSGGAVAGRVPLGCFAGGSEAIRHPDGRHVGLAVGEGQDGQQLYWGHIEAGQPRVAHAPTDDRVLVDVSPDGGRYLTTPHYSGPALLHAFPGGAVAARLEPERVGGDEDAFDWFAGYLDAGRVLLSLREEDDLLVASAGDLSPLGRLEMPRGRAGNAVIASAAGTFLCHDWDASEVTLWRAATPLG